MKIRVEVVVCIGGKREWMGGRVLGVVYGRVDLGGKDEVLGR